MPLLQVRECPEELYTNLSMAAKNQNRSIAQQTVFMLRQSFEMEDEKYKNRRKKTLECLEDLAITLPPEAQNPVSVLREDRDRRTFFEPKGAL